MKVYNLAVIVLEDTFVSVIRLSPVISGYSKEISESRLVATILSVDPSYQ